MVPYLQGRRLRAGEAPDFVPDLVARFRGNAMARAGQAPGIKPEAVLPWLVDEASDAKPSVSASRTPGFRSGQARSSVSASNGSLRLRFGVLGRVAQFGRAGGFRGFPYNHALEATVKPRSCNSSSGGRPLQGNR